jgi:hypothetical protein
MVKPIFKDAQDWERAELLMQPALIRVIDHLRQTLETSSWQGQYEEVLEPYPGYHLHLRRQDHHLTLDLWDLCFQICFVNYHPHPFQQSEPERDHAVTVAIDSTLLNDQGEVDWHALDDKTQGLIQRLFAALPGEIETS